MPRVSRFRRKLRRLDWIDLVVALIAAVIAEAIKTEFRSMSLGSLAVAALAGCIAFLIVYLCRACYLGWLREEVLEAERDTCRLERDICRGRLEAESLEVGILRTRTAAIQLLLEYVCLRNAEDAAGERKLIARMFALSVRLWETLGEEEKANINHPVTRAHSQILTIRHEMQPSQNLLEPVEAIAAHFDLQHLF